MASILVASLACKYLASFQTLALHLYVITITYKHLIGTQVLKRDHFNFFQKRSYAQVSIMLAYHSSH